MGVGEDESLGNEVSVTVIATGFGKEQQNEISNTEAKKIIHSLEEEQKLVHDLSKEKEINISQNNFEESIPFVDEISKQKMEVENEPLIQMNSILFNIQVDEEIIENGILQDSFEEGDKIDSEPFSILDDNFKGKTQEKVDDKRYRKIRCKYI